MDEGDDSACAYCGGATDAPGWLVLEVSRPRTEDPSQAQVHDYLDLLFCSEAHAGCYLSEGRLPPPAAPPVPAPLTRWERAQGWLIGIAIVAVLLWCLFLFGLGAWTFVRHLRGS